MSRPVRVFAGIFHVNRNPRKILKHDFPGKPCVAAGTACRNHEPLSPSERLCNRLKRLCR